MPRHAWEGPDAPPPSRPPRPVGRHAAAALASVLGLSAVVILVHVGLGQHVLAGATAPPVWPSSVTTTPQEAPLMTVVPAEPAVAPTVRVRVGSVTRTCGLTGGDDVYECPQPVAPVMPPTSTSKGR